MSVALVIDALAIPSEARVDQRVPKKLIIEQGAPTASDKRQLQNGIEELFWVAALKPTNIGVSIFRDNVREYLEIAVLSVTFRATAKPTRLIELIHRAIPYPVLLMSTQGETVNLSLAHKRWSQGESGKVVIEDLRCTAPFRSDSPTAEETLFLASLALSGLPRRDLFDLYQGWLNRVAALEAAQITGIFAPSDSMDNSSVMRENLDTYIRLQSAIVQLRAQAAKEKQINRRVELNLEIKRIELELATILELLKKPCDLSSTSYIF